MKTFRAILRFAPVFGLGALTYSCQLGDLLKPNAPGKLTVSPPDIAVSASAGSSQMRSATLSIASDGGSKGAWRAAVLGGSSWLGLSSATDTVPASVTVMLTPGTLSVGTYRDTIQLVSEGRDDDVVRIPVVFTIVAAQHPPAVPSALAQFRIDGTTAIPVGGLTTERTVLLTAVVTDPDPGDSIRLEAEFQPIGAPFSNVPNAISAPRASGGTAAAAATGLADYTSYHWQARAADRSGARSSWVSFGGNGEDEADFRAVLPPTQLVFLTQPTNATAGATLAPPVRVAVQDQGGSTLSYFNGVITLSISANPSDAVLKGTVSQQAANGIAVFPDLRIDRAGTGYLLAASSPGLPGVTSTPFDIAPGAAAAAQFTTQPTRTPAGTAITPAVQVTALDRAGNVVTAFAGPVTVAIAANPSAGLLAGTTTTNASAGIATFGDLTIDRPGTGYTLRATLSGATPVVSDAFDIVAGNAATLAFTVQPSGTAAGAAITPPVQVTALDRAGNVATTFTGPITVSIAANPAGGVLSGTLTANAARGVATFADLTIDHAGTGYTLRATTAGATAATSAPFDIAAGGVSATRSTLAVSPNTIAASNGNVTATLTVVARDASGNPLTGAPVTISATGTGNTLVPASGPTDGTGQFTATISSKVAETKTISATVRGVAIAQIVTVSVTPGPATTLVFSAQPTSTKAKSVIQPAIVVSALDAFGNRVPGFAGAVTVRIGTNPAGGTLTGTLTVAATNDNASFADLSIDNPGTGYTLAASSNGLTGATSAPFNINP